MILLHRVSAVLLPDEPRPPVGSTELGASDGGKDHQMGAHVSEELFAGKSYVLFFE